MKQYFKVLKFITFLLFFDAFNVRINNLDCKKNYCNEDLKYECVLDNIFDVHLLNEYCESSGYIEIEFSCENSFNINNGELSYDILKKDDKYRFKVYNNANEGDYYLDIVSNNGKILELFLYSDGLNVSASLASINDAKSKYYKKFIDVSNNIMLSDLNETSSSCYDQMSQYNNFVFENEDYTYTESIKEYSEEN